MIGPMLGILGRRLLTAVPMVLLVSIMVFVVLRLLPADPLGMMLPPSATLEDQEAMRRALGLDRSIAEQYVIWLGNALQGDLGNSIQFREGVLSLIGKTLPATIELALLALVMAGTLGIAGGLTIFHLRGTRAEPAADLGVTIMMSVPDFLWGIFLILAFGVAWTLLPFTGRVGAGMILPGITGFVLVDSLLIGRPDMFLSGLLHLLLPALALALAFAPLVMRVLRSSLLEAIGEDYVTLARLRGLGERRVLVSHALKNAALPAITLIGVQFGFLFGGTLLVEVIYSYPGLGSLMVQAVRNLDLPVIQGVALTYCVMVLLTNAVVDMVYLALNPKLRPAR